MSKQYNTILFDTKKFEKLTVLERVKIGPELAGELLVHDTNNRPIRDRLVKKYASDMRKGKWEYNGDSLRFSKTAKLIDGQHRLLAVIESGTEIYQNIQSGLDDQCFDKMDIGQSRTASDTVAVAGYENSQTLAGAIKLIKAYNEKTLQRTDGGTTKGGRYSNADVVEYLKKLNIPLLEECGRFGNKCVYKAKFFSSPTYTAFAYLFSVKDREEAFFFFDLLTTGENIGKNNFSMIYLLRQKLIRIQQSNTMMQQLDKLALLIKSWNHFRTKKEIAHLSWVANKEDFPTIQ